MFDQRRSLPLSLSLSLSILFWQIDRNIYVRAPRDLGNRFLDRGISGIETRAFLSFCRDKKAKLTCSGASLNVFT